jgi:hypothetical protein
MTTTLHLTRFDYTQGWIGSVVPHSVNPDRAIVQGSTWSKTFTLSGDRTSSTFSSVVNDRWRDEDTDAITLLTASCTAAYEADGDITNVVVEYDGNDTNEIATTKNVKTGSEARQAKAGVNYYVFEFREIASNGKPFVHFTGYVEVHPRAGVD